VGCQNIKTVDAGKGRSGKEDALPEKVKTARSNILLFPIGGQVN
jgi:hypothetical protein